MNYLRQQFIKETGIRDDNWNGIGDYHGLQADYHALRLYCNWLENRISTLEPAPPITGKNER